MSKRIIQTINVIEEIRENSRIQPNSWTIRRIRNEATKAVAERLDITKQAVESKFITQLQPYVKNAKHFDELVKTWLFESSDELQNILLRYAKTTKDEERIKTLFYRAPEEDILLAQTFGYDPAEREFKEGKANLRIHLAKERNRNLVNLAKNKWNKQQAGDIKCAICFFSFMDKYGQIGEGFIEAHHIKPISELAPDTIIRIDDLIPVCSNCHSILHRRNPSITVKELQDAVIIARK